jgi:hypothetical protein
MYSLKREREIRKHLKKNINFWPDNFIKGSENVLLTSDAILKNYKILLDKKCNENTIHKFIKLNPTLLAYMMYGGKGNWLFSKPKFGCEYIPDFIMCTQDSAGFHWAIVELESPNKKVLRNNGQQTAHLSNAVKQINEWRIWLRKNIAYARYGLGYFDIDAECTALIVIGRRKFITPELKDYYRELSNNNLRIMSYDRLSRY